MKLACLAAGVLLGAAAHAAQPASTEANPAVNTSPPAAAQPAAPRGNQAPVAAQPATPAATTPRPNNRAAATDRIELEATQITGNAELPRVMYVVPWKRAELGELAGKPARSLLDEVLAPVDRDVFRRQNRYYNALQPDAAQAAPAGEK